MGMINRLKDNHVVVTAPCRLDMGGTLDMTAFHYPMGHLNPVTFNIALDMRTRVRVSPFKKGWVRVASRGFESAEFPLKQAPFNHPLGLMFAVAAYFDADGVSIDIDSPSPPRSALGGSSVAAVALCAAFLSMGDEELNDDGLRKQASQIAYYIEGSIAGGPCGIQDHLAAAYGGVNAWYWQKSPDGISYTRTEVVDQTVYGLIEKRLLIAYCGEPHESLNVNSRWLTQFLSGTNRSDWAEIIHCTHAFIHALGKGDFPSIYPLMNRETELRRHMTPDVLDDVGVGLVDAAKGLSCGVRFTGAGGGGCIWALCEEKEMPTLSHRWHQVLSSKEGAMFLPCGIDPQGLLCKNEQP